MGCTLAIARSLLHTSMPLTWWEEWPCTTSTSHSSISRWAKVTYAVCKACDGVKSALKQPFRWVRSIFIVNIIA